MEVSRSVSFGIERPLSCDICGQLISPGGFLHHRRRFENSAEYKQMISKHIGEWLIRFDAMGCINTDVRFQKHFSYIVAGESVHLPAPECLMVQELVPGGLDGMKGEVDYSFYESLK